ncbi:hypothetical protein NLJ89_g9650 [Agrocybe chaxingu]|uniref:Uncharacterized protein n=1 Tax=Agrocybe chaxingu TaxID=84603 RepID=A0A9W8JT24_9AGAR|nr:hypothetical protein NLJ89_g9650 [Agrocybe chaxingu]
MQLQHRVQIAPAVFRADLLLTISDAVVKELEARESEFFETGAVDLSALVEASQCKDDLKPKDGLYTVDYDALKFKLSQERNDSSALLHRLRKEKDTIVSLILERYTEIPCSPKALRELFPCSDAPGQLQVVRDCRSWIEDTRKFPILLKTQIKALLQEKAERDKTDTSTEGLGEHDKRKEDLKAMVQRIKNLEGSVTALVNLVNSRKTTRATESKGLNPQPPRTQMTELQQPSGMPAIAGLTDRLDQIRGDFIKHQETREADEARISELQKRVDEALNPTTEGSDPRIFGPSESFEPSALQPAINDLTLEHFPALVAKFIPDFKQYQDSDEVKRYFYQAIERALVLIHELLMSPTEGDLVPAYELEEGEIFDVESLLVQGLRGLL